MPATPAPIVLEGRHVRLEPLALDHVPALFRVGGGDEEVWLTGRRRASAESLPRQPF
jgi:hypothetical protein